MNMGKIDKKLESEILEWKKMIGFFVHSGNIYWIIDWVMHFNLNFEKEIDAYCEKPELQKFKPEGLTTEQWRVEQMNNFRSGIPILVSEHFPRYLSTETATIVDTPELRNLFWSKDSRLFIEYISELENSNPGEEELSDELESLESDLFAMLPKFYINFDKKSFKHTISDRRFEHYVPEGWTGEFEEFNALIPEKERYWVSKDGIDMSEYV